MFVLICNSWGPKVGLDVTDQDYPAGWFGLSQSVTRGTDFAELLLQIEIFRQTDFECLVL